MNINLLSIYDPNIIHISTYYHLRNINWSLIAHPHHETSFLDSIFTRLPNASKEVLQVFALHPQMVQRMVQAGRKCLPRESLGIATQNTAGEFGIWEWITTHEISRIFLGGERGWTSINPKDWGMKPGYARYSSGFQRKSDTVTSTMW